MNRPNIVFLFSDDHALQAISAYGGPLRRIAPTPGIDRIAREGAIFRNSFCANSICGPSRACILTGKHSHANGFVDNENSRFDGSQTTFPKLLQAAGYQTALFGKWHLISEPTGFDTWEVLPGQGNYVNPDFLLPGRVRRRYPGHVTGITTGLATNWLERRRDPSRPFLLMCQHKAPHRNWIPAPEHLNLFQGVRFPEPRTLFDDYSRRASALARNEMRVDRDLTWVSDLKLPRLPRDAGGERDVNGELARMTPEQRAAWDASIGVEGQRLLEAVESGKLSGRDLVRAKLQRYLADYLRCVRGVDDSVRTVLDTLDRMGLAENTVVVYASDQGFYLGEHGWYDKRWIFEESLKMPFLVRWPGRIRPGSRPDALVQNIDYAPTFLEMAGVPVPTEMQGRSLLPILEGRTPKDWRDAVYYRYTGEQIHAVAAHDGVRTRRHKLVRFPWTDEWNLFDLARDPDETRSVHDHPAYRRTFDDLRGVYDRLRREFGVPADPPRRP